MRGSPLLRAALVLVFLLALAPLIGRITREHPPVRPPKPAEIVQTPRVAEGAWTFTTAPVRVALKHLGSEIWSKASPGSSEQFSIAIPWPKEGVELQVLVEWPQGTETAAARLRLVAPDGTEYERTVWGDANASEVLSFP